MTDTARSQTYENERVVLGCMARYVNCFESKMEKLSADLFADELHREIFCALLEAYREGHGQYDLQLIVAHITDPDAKDELYKCADIVFESTPFDQHFRTLIKAAKQRFIRDQIAAAQMSDELTTERLREITDIADRAYSDADGTKYIRLSDIDSTRTEWLWKPYIPLGKITLMTADPGTGKTFLSLYLASQVSTGRPFYGEENGRAPAVAVYQTAEDGIADTIKPRLECMQPDFDNIYIFDESEKGLSLSDDTRIEKIMKDLHPKLMIFDPLQAYLGAKVDMNRANEVRPVLGRIGHLAEQYQCAVIFIMHHSKASQNPALHRALGSMDIPAVARNMLVLGKDPENKARRILCHEKSSLAAAGQSISFEINPGFGGILFSGYSELKADDILNVRTGTRNKPSKKRDDLIDDILALFGEKDYIKVPKIDDLCRQLGCSPRTLYRARDELGIRTSSKGYGKDRVTYWIMPDADVDTDRFFEDLDKQKLPEGQL